MDGTGSGAVDREPIARPLGKVANLGCCIALTGAVTLAASGSPRAADVTGAWEVNANGQVGTLSITAATAGKLAGKLFGNNINGYFDNASGRIAFVRIINSSDPKANQIFTGYFMQDKVPQAPFLFVYHLAGTFQAFDGGGGTVPRNVFGWYGTQNISRPK